MKQSFAQGGIMVAQHSCFKHSLQLLSVCWWCCGCAGDLSRNNWWVALLAFGEGWHNTHHAFAHSARHGLEWYELDPCYYCICGLKALGLVWDIRLPSEAEKARKRKPDQKQKIW